MLTDLIFDFFGTLVEYDPGRLHGEERLAFAYLRSQGFPFEYQEYATRLDVAFRQLEAEAKVTQREFHMNALGERLFEGVPFRRTQEVLDRFVSLFVEEWNRGTVYPPGIEQFVTRIRSRYRLSILSNSHYPPVIHSNLRAMQIAPCFSQVVVSAEVGIRKPSPEIFHHTLRLLGIPPDHALYVGDTYEDDYLGARSAGIRSCLIDKANRYADGVILRIGHLFELPAVFAP